MTLSNILSYGEILMCKHILIGDYTFADYSRIRAIEEIFDSII